MSDTLRLARHLPAFAFQSNPLFQVEPKQQL